MAIRYLSGINVDSNTLFVDDANNRVGIGTGSPTAKLQLYGSGLVEAKVTSTNDQALLYLQGTFGQVANNAGDFYITNSAPSSSLILRTADTERMRITAAGNVGIGTTSPSNPLHVEKDAGGNAIAYFNSLNADGYGVAIRTADTGNDKYVLRLDSNSGSTPVMYATNAGNVGIGTTSPSHKFVVSNGSAEVFQVYNSGEIVAVTNYIYAAYSGGTSFYSQGPASFRNGIYSDTAAYLTINGGTSNNTYFSGNVGIGTTSPATKLDVNGGINIANGNNLTWGGDYAAGIPTIAGYNAGAGGALYFYPNGSTSGTKMFIASDGNVGIGTTAPGSKLDVYLPEGSYVRATNASSGVGAGNHWGFGLYEGTALSAAFRIVRDGTADQVSIGTAVNQPFAFWQNNTERMRIAVGGNVGIGTTSPAYTLDVSGTARTTTGTYLGTSSGNVIVGGTTSDLIGGFKFIAIGNTAIQYAASTGTYLRIEPGAADTQVALKADARSGAYPPMAFHTSDTERMRITSAGNVGIGTTAPDAKLVIVTGSTDDSGNSFSFTGYGSKEYVSISKLGFIRSRASDLNGANMHFLDNGGTNRMEMAVNTTSMNWYSHALGSTFMVFQHTTGNVGIGTTNPLSLLHVYGSNPRNLIQDAGAGYPYIQLNNSSGNFYISIDNSSGSGFGAAYGRYLYSEGAYPMIFTTDSAERLRITGAGNVGIGTTSTFGRLQISGTVGNPDLSSATATGVSLVISNNDTGYGTMFATYGNGNGALQQRRTNTNTYYDFLLQPHGGNVGIGTSSPVVKLQVDGTITSTGVLTAYTSVPSINIGHNGDSAFIAATSGSGANTPISFSVGNNNEKMRITADGNVGIGTTSPSGKLTLYTDGDQTLRFTHPVSGTFPRTDRIVFGSPEVDGGSSAIYGVQTAASGAPGYLSFYTTSGGSSFERMRIASTGATRLNAYGSGSFTGTVAYNLAVDSSGNIIETAGGVVDGSGTANYVSKWSDANTLTDSQLFDNGTNVGIGTASLGSWAKLQVNGNFAVTGTLFSFSNDLVGGSTPAYLDYNYSSGKLIIGSYGPSASGYIVLETGGTEKARITATGNVGIGTTSPAAKLQVGNGTSNSPSSVAVLSADGGNAVLNALSLVNSRSAANGNGTSINFHNANNYGPTGRITSVQDSGTNASLRFSVYNSTDDALVERITLLSSGNVGIGTTAPPSHLSVVGNIESIITVSTATVNYLKLGTYYAGQWGSYVGAGSNYSSTLDTDLRLGVSSGGTATEVIRITSSGNVGIGTTATESKLHVVYGAGEAGLLSRGPSGDTWFPYNNGQNYVRGVTNFDLGSVYFTGGNVGIGTTSPSQALHVSGNIRVTGAYYDSSNSAGSSGQVLSSTGSGTDWVSLSEITGVDGTGTANYIAKWSDTDTITNSQVFDNGTNVGINNASPKTKLDVNGAIGFGSKTLNISDTFVTVLTVNMSNHTGCYVKITAFGDWNGHSAVAYLGEFFLQNGASAYNEPGVIIRQVDNTNTDDVVAQIVDPAGTGTRDFEIQLKTTSASGVPFSAAIQYEVRGQYNSVS